MIAQIFGYTYPHYDYIIAIKIEYFNKKLINIRTFFLDIAQIVSTKQKRPKNGSNYIENVMLEWNGAIAECNDSISGLCVHGDSIASIRNDIKYFG